MGTTTKINVMCPACGAEVVLPIRKVEVDVTDAMMFPNGIQHPTALRTDVIAEGPHTCPLRTDD